MASYKVEICGINTSKLPLLSNEEKETLFKKIQAGDKEAREKYIKGNLRFVLRIGNFQLRRTDDYRGGAQALKG